MHDLFHFWPTMLVIIAGLIVFSKAWSLLPIFGIVALLGYTVLGLLVPLWLSSGPVSGTLVLCSVLALVLAAGTTLCILRRD